MWKIMKALKGEFFKECKTKPFYSFLKRWFGGREYSDIEIAKALSSMVTHSIIELQKKGEMRYSALEVAFQADTVAKFIGGELSANKVKEMYKSKFGKWVNFCEDEKSED